MAAAPVKAVKKSGTSGPPSLLRAGTGSKRVNTRFIVLYGPPKARKTTSCSTIEGAKWIISDSNCVPTLDALGRLPPDADIYEVADLAETTALIDEMIEAAEKGGLDLPAVVVDSLTSFSDWHQQDVAKQTAQRFLGDNPKSNSWQQFNAEFGKFIDALGTLSKHVTVVAIAHAKEKADSSKGEWSGLNLPPQMALKTGRTANWVLYQSIRSYAADDGATESDFIQLIQLPDGAKRAVETTIHTQPVGLWIASCSSRLDPKTKRPVLAPEEPADMAKLLEKEGLL